VLLTGPLMLLNGWVDSIILKEYLDTTWGLPA
jgi:hypothetical protein